MSGKLKPKQSKDREQSVFINAPYGPEHQDLFLAYVVGAAGMGLIARAGVESFGESTARLQKLYAVMRDCRYSFHDLSCVSVDAQNPVPRFNMPLELGMAVAEESRAVRSAKHTWIAFDSEPYRHSQTASDIVGLDRVLNHRGQPTGIFRELLSNLDLAPPLREQTLNYVEMIDLFAKVKAAVPDIIEGSGRQDIFAPITFGRVAALATQLRADIVSARAAG